MEMMGEIRCFGFDFAPRGWIKCDGQLLQIAGNSALFSLLGTLYGGDGRTTFGVPDLRGRTAVHNGAGPGLMQRKIGQKFGSDTVSLTTQQMPSHNHSGHVVVSDSGANSSKTKGYLASAQIYIDPAASTQNLADGTVVTKNAGGGQPHDNSQPSLALNWCICAVGTYPSRS